MITEGVYTRLPELLTPRIILFDSAWIPAGRSSVVANDPDCELQDSAAGADADEDDPDGDLDDHDDDGQASVREVSGNVVQKYAARGRQAAMQHVTLWVFARDFNYNRKTKR